MAGVTSHTPGGARPWVPVREVVVAETFDRAWFYREHVDPGVPVILRGAASAWPAVQSWSFDSLARMGREERVTLSIGVEEVGVTVKSRSRTLAEHIQAISGNSPTTSPPLRCLRCHRPMAATHRRGTSDVGDTSDTGAVHEVHAEGLVAPG